jgi:hypothetical protein
MVGHLSSILEKEWFFSVLPCFLLLTADPSIICNSSNTNISGFAQCFYIYWERRLETGEQNLNFSYNKLLSDDSPQHIIGIYKLLVASLANHYYTLLVYELWMWYMHSALMIVMMLFNQLDLIFKLNIIGNPCQLYFLPSLLLY